MHPRSCFATPPDLKLLAQAFPDLRPLYACLLIDGSYLDYNDPNALRAVTRCYFKHFFGLTVAIPVDRLCPTLGNRLNYVLWLEDLVSETRLDDKPVVGLDVGTGATAVYPLLTIAQNKQWRMLATESDQRSFEAARDNLKQNSLSERIILLKADVDAPILLQHNAVISQPLNFVMCNPPFYTDEEEIATSAKLKGGAKSAAFIGSPSEMITPGGEVAFTLRLFEESKALQKRIQWYTTMLGKLSSVEQLVGHLRSAGINNYVLHELTQGKTRRWVVGWSFAPQR
ncbi:ribosomal RNA large subunit methyltransferase F-like protein, partial [Protomyces lactucae-debilis]